MFVRLLRPAQTSVTSESHRQCLIAITKRTEAISRSHPRISQAPQPAQRPGTKPAPSPAIPRYTVARIPNARPQASGTRHRLWILTTSGSTK
ncbi:hypothetical protein SNOG_08711 [Parastagonospora nodorum SN15]|uniref:Uncharacterized protein n=1 Tax=Phaeosphaeria nodorum (strain SN15 / ATCC MYA-4574 / FGSC 10173) TaxID=321614 RepID=Q0UHQ3_PHANO|nr:hypothetical protein SNOG_08711 [Parastagonospora nodorum SN15]EAT83879.1 hypothetical protein SNOG_08711 [Parastagonospora nodorum SN15]